MFQSICLCQPRLNEEKKTEVGIISVASLSLWLLSLSFSYMCTPSVIGTLSISTVLILMDIHGYSVVILKSPDHLFLFKSVFHHRSIFLTYLVFNTLNINQTLQSQEQSHNGKTKGLQPSICEKYSQNNEDIFEQKQMFEDHNRMATHVHWNQHRID